MKLTLVVQVTLLDLTERSSVGQWFHVIQLSVLQFVYITSHIECNAVHRTHTHTQIRTYTHIHTCTHRRTQMRAHTQKRACTQTHTSKPDRSLSNQCTFVICPHMHMCLVHMPKPICPETPVISSLFVQEFSM